MNEYSIEGIISRQPKLNPKTGEHIWAQFVKWSFGVFDSERQFGFGRLGNYGCKIEQNTGRKIPFLFFNELFLKEKRLINKLSSFLLKPLIKVNYAAIAKYCYSSIKEDDVQYLLIGIIEEVEKVLSDIRITVARIDFDTMGHIVKKGNEVWFEYVLEKPKKNVERTKQISLRKLVQKQENMQIQIDKLPRIGQQERSRIGTQDGTRLGIQERAKISIRQRISQTAPRKESLQRKIDQQREQENPKKRVIVQQSSNLDSFNETNSFMRRGKSLSKLQKSGQMVRLSSMKEFGRASRVNSVKKKQSSSQAIGWQMMGAGEDPLKKNQDFAHLTGDLPTLMKTTFQFPQKSVMRSLPVLDVFSRTLGCPIATQRQNPLVAARIGSHLSLPTQHFYITEEGVQIVVNASKALIGRKQQKHMYILSEQQEYELTMKQILTEQEKQSLIQKSMNNQRLLKLHDMIDDKHVLELSSKKMRNILKLVDTKLVVEGYLPEDEKEIIEELIKDVSQEFQVTIKKAIIDYILLDPTEATRLNVIIRQLPTSFAGKIQPLFPLYSANSIVKRQKAAIQKNLLKNSRNVIRIQTEWLAKYESKSLLVLPQQLQPNLVVDTFCQSQKNSIKTQKQVLINEWMHSVSDIYRNQINQLNRHQQKCQQFFDSTACLLHIQVRNIINRQLEAYENFICNYDIKDLNPPETVVHLQRSANRYEKCFLSVKISYRKDEIYFMDNLEEIDKKLLDVVDSILDFGQILPRPENLITKTEHLFQFAIPKTDHVYLRVRSTIERVVKRNIDNTRKCLKIYKKYEFLLGQIRVLEQWISQGGHDRREYSLMFNKYRNLYNQVKDTVPSFIRMNMIYVDSIELKRYLLKCLDQLLFRLQKSVYELIMRKNNQVQSELVRMVTVATSSVFSCQKLVQVENEMDGFRRSGIVKLQEKSNDMLKWLFMTLYNTFYPISEQDMTIFNDTAQFLRDIYGKLDSADTQIFEMRKELQTEAKKESVEFYKKFQFLIVEIETLKEFGSNMLRDSALELLGSCRQKINTFKGQLDDLNYRERLLAMDETEPTKLLEWDKNLKPFEELWNLVKNYMTLNQTWTRQSIFKQDADSIAIQIKIMLKNAIALSSNVIIRKIAPNTIKIADDLVEDIKQFQHNCPLIAVFSNPGLKARHLEQISKKIGHTGQPLTLSSNLYLSKLLSFGAGEHIEELQAISQTATKEYMIETTLQKMSKQWGSAKLQMKRYKDTQIGILTGPSIEEIRALLDDHSLKVLTIKGSVYAKTFQKEIEELNQWLNSTNELIDYSVKVQTVWMYLEPVMTSPDILKHLSIEGSKFKIVDELWREITQIYSKLLLVREITKNAKIIPNLKKCHGNLEVVQKGLNNYLESKRLNFPRFFFLSNEELLEILSETKDPTRVQPHLKKCFEGIHRLSFEDKKIITGMYSSQNQYIGFAHKIDTVLARGNVDQWLLEVEERMISSVKQEIRQSHHDYESLPRKQCLLKQCAMSILTVQMANWTHFIEQNIQQQTLTQSVTTTKNSLQTVIEMIKQQSLKAVHAITLEALIVLSVHNLDITRDLEKQGTASISDFAWESQLRYYYPFKDLEQGSCTEVRILNAVCYFAHQYIGNTSRLVITPLTDRCYRTLCSAVHLNYGGAPEGPAGTGKTETVKDLAKALACQCVVFNCSDGLDYKAMGKFFKGLAASGAWSCFDEFNRINLEVLSVVAQQILSIQTAKARREQILFFEDAAIQLKANANCFITMNPGYAGRSELPDNLKALFRSVAMMIPDYAMIAEISLYSYGFQDARNMARKIVTTYKLCSQQLSSQQHYDYGMRAVKSVLIAAGNLKRRYQLSNQSSLILKAINDVNVAKFLFFDIPLFNGITNDLFPNTVPPTLNYEGLIEGIKCQFAYLKLTLTPYSLEKIIQIYEMILVRHGLMVVGYPFAGKTSALTVLAKALQRCQATMKENAVEICKINPKSINMKQLYGSFDEVSHQWFDGVLAVKFRGFASSTDPKRKWLLLDGPVDAMWIENMNTVLDDNKKLCLNSGQIVAMSKQMSLIFEPMDLLAASPATVSRCGMIYLEPASLGHQVMISSWMSQQQWLFEDGIKILKEYFVLLDSLYLQMKSLKTICYTSIFHLTHTFLRLISYDMQTIKRIKEEKEQKYVQIDQKQKLSLITGCFVYATVWSFGACVDTVSRKQFDIIIKRIFTLELGSNRKRRYAQLPEKMTLYDYHFEANHSTMDYQWVKWTNFIEENSLQQQNVKIHQIIVKTNDIVRYSKLIEFCIKNNIPALLCGPTGTGKTTLIKNIYRDKINPKEIGMLQIIFSSKITCSQVQEQLQVRLDKRGSRTVLGPKSTPRMITYIDDLNTPIKEKYGAQPSIELLRQVLDQHGLYDLKQKQKPLKNIIDVTFLYSMGSINNEISPRFLRHVNLISITNFQQETLIRIFSTILTISFQGHAEQKNVMTLLKYCIELYEECVKKLLPTPTKLHYIFNLRDLWKLVIGICRADKHKVNVENIGRLWAHEVKRTFMDRLLPGEKGIVENMMSSISKRWGKNISEVYFSDILSSNSTVKSYEEIHDLEKINLSVTAALNNFNAVSDKPMNLVLFDYALQHILIILRIIRQPRGNALLIGMGGSGRKSFANLASFIAEYTPMSVQVTENYNFAQFRQDIKKIFKQVGVKNKYITFLFSDSHIKEQQFLEEINNILNIGIVPNLFPADERIEICESIRKDAMTSLSNEVTIDKLFEFFLERVKNQLKLVVCFSPIGESFRARLRMFPSLVNCTTIDWYDEWPKEGLLSVANKFLTKTDLKNRDIYIKMFQYLHSSAKIWSTKFKDELKRYFYVTPTTYIEFIVSFRQLLDDKRKQIKQLIFKYENGNAKIIQTEQSVQSMKKSLEQMKPQLKKAASDTVIKMQMAKRQKEQADVIMRQILGEEKIVLEAVSEANAIKQQCEKQLAIAMPKLKAAENALLVLDKSSLTELKAMLNPPIAIKYVMQGLCLLIDPAPKERMKNEKTLKMQVDWWAASVRNLSNPRLLNDLVSFNREGLSEAVVNNLGKFLNDPANKDILSVQNVANSSAACECIIQWVNGIYNFYFVNKKVKPKKQSLKIAQQKVKQLNDKLQVKRNELDAANQKAEDLNQELEWARKNKQKLEFQYKQCELCLQRASIIISSLGSEKVRWLELSEEYKMQAELADVSIFMASAQISYLGPFTPSFRTKIVEQWCEKFQQQSLAISPTFSLGKFLGDPIIIRQWNINGLPQDNFSVQNGIIMTNSRRWPLMIDPQGQANKWLKNQEAVKKIKIIKLTDDNFIRNLENCIQFGTPVLIENIGSEINSALTPVLLKQTYKKGATTYMKVGETVLIYSNDFSLYLTTKLRNPHYQPDVCTQVVLINFMITDEGLTDQLLALLVSRERPDLEKEKEKLVLESADNKRMLKDIQDKILDILSNSENILSDQTAINVLSESKSKSIQISDKQKQAEETQRLIDEARSQYREVASQGSHLFFVVSDLGNLDTMYQYSLIYFTDLYKIAISKSERSEQLVRRLNNLKTYFRVSLFRNISRSLFQKDRLLFSVLIVLKLGKIQPRALRFLLTSSFSKSKISVEKPNNAAWIDDRMWAEVCRLSQIDPFKQILLVFNDKLNRDLMEQISTEQHPFTKLLPNCYNELPLLQKILLFKCLRPEKMLEAFTLLVEQYLGADFIRSQPFDLSRIYPDSNPRTPLLFLLSSGTDPFISVLNFSKSKQISLDSVSLGQGQGTIAEKIVRTNIQKGGWVVLQNCHLAVSWMQSLQKIVEEFDSVDTPIDNDFRLWLTSYPNDTFPQSVLQKALKMTNEPPKGLKNNLLMSYLADPVNDPAFFESSLYNRPFKKLLFSLCFFHSLIQQRRNYGPLGWNISYEFTESDLRISSRQLKIYIDSMTGEDNVPFEALKYLIAECNYGGRVTDQNDRRLLTAILQTFYCREVLQNHNFSFGDSPFYVLPEQINDYQQYLEYIERLPSAGSPELVGLHRNGDITKDITQSSALLESLLACSSQSTTPSKSEQSPEQQIQKIVQQILSESTFPNIFNEQQVLKRYPVLYEQSMNTVLNQEIARYNKLIQAIESTLLDLIKALKGELVMTSSLEKMSKALYDGKVPDLWMEKSYPSLKSLGNYIADLQKRVCFFEHWVANGIPSEFWLSGFFFTQSFLTGVLQNYSRRNKIPVDELAYTFIFNTGQLNKCQQGANVYGLYIEGACWDAKHEQLKQSHDRELFSLCPNIYFKPDRLVNIQQVASYEAPLYKTVLRRGVLSTTGHSTNFVMMVCMPTDIPSAHWIKRGVALLTQII